MVINLTCLKLDERSFVRGHSLVLVVESDFSLMETPLAWIINQKSPIRKKQVKIVSMLKLETKY
jgi:hypothetical protein